MDLTAPRGLHLDVGRTCQQICCQHRPGPLLSPSYSVAPLPQVRNSNLSRAANVDWFL